MSIVRIPNENRQFKKSNIGEVFGNIWDAYGIDFDSNRGKINITPRTKINTQNDETHADLGYPIGFVYKFSSGKFYAAAGSFIHVGGTTPTDAFTKDSAAGTPTDLAANYSDIKIWNGNIVCTSEDTLYQFSSSWSTLFNSYTASSGYQHILEEGFDTNLYHSDANKLRKRTIAGVDSTALTLLGQYHISSLKSSSNKIWIGSYDSSGREGQIFEWDGTSTAANKSYGCGSVGVMAIAIKDDIPYVLNSKMQLMKYNGARFVVIDKFPMTGKNDTFLLGADNTHSNNRPVHPNGMAFIDGSLHIVLRGTYATSPYTIIENLPSGAWVYDEEIGLHCKYPFTLYSGSVTDYGQFCISFAGAISGTNSSSAKLLIGVGLYSDNATTEKKCILNDNIADNIQKRGYYISTQIHTPSITAVAKTIGAKFSKLINATDRIYIKHRKTKVNGLPFIAAITWTDTSTFTSTDSNFAYAAVGDEVFVAMGVGGNQSAHIATISYVSGTGTYTITLGSTITGATGTGKVIVNNWKLVQTVTNQNVESTTEDAGSGEHISYQFKVELMSTGKLEVDEVQVSMSQAQTIE